MMTRRVLLGTGAVVAGGAGLLGAAQITHRLDDAARLVGLSPKPEPDPKDAKIVRQSGRDQAVVTAAAQALHEAQPKLRLEAVVALCSEQLVAIGGSTATTDLAQAPASADELADLLRTSSRACAARANEAFSPELIRVLASMSAGLAQCERHVRRLA